MPGVLRGAGRADVRDQPAARPAPSALRGEHAGHVGASACPRRCMSSQFERGTSQKRPCRTAPRRGIRIGVVHEDVEPSGLLRVTRSNRPPPGCRRGGRSATAMPRPPSRCHLLRGRAVPWCRAAGAPPSSTVRPVTYTVAPAAPSSSAQPLPMPRLAPVTTATAPSSDSASQPAPRRRCLRHGLLAARAGEEVRVHARVEAHRVHADEVAEVWPRRAGRPPPARGPRPVPPSCPARPSGPCPS